MTPACRVLSTVAGARDPGLFDDLSDGVAAVSQVGGVVELGLVDEDRPTDAPTLGSGHGARMRDALDRVGTLRMWNAPSDCHDGPRPEGNRLSGCGHGLLLGVAVLRGNVRARRASPSESESDSAQADVGGFCRRSAASAVESLIGAFATRESRSACAPRRFDDQTVPGYCGATACRPSGRSRAAQAAASSCLSRLGRACVRCYAA